MRRPSGTDLWIRLARRVLTSASRLLVLARDRRRLSRLLRSAAPADGRPLFAIIAVPGQEELATRNARRAAEHCRLLLLQNGLRRREARRQAQAVPAAHCFRASALPGCPARHGTLLRLLLEVVEEDFGVLDADCFVRDPALYRIPDFGAGELLAAPDQPGFYTDNAATGLRFPRTHLLIFHTAVVRALMSNRRVTAEKRMRPPRRLAAPLARLGLGTHNFPRSDLGHFDTLLLLLSVGYAEGLSVRWLPAAADQVLHWQESTAIRWRRSGDRRRQPAPAPAASEAAGPARTGRRPGTPGKALLCHASLDRYSGSQMVVLEVAEELSRRGWTVHVATRRLAGRFGRELRRGGYRVDTVEAFAGRRFDLAVVFDRRLDMPLRRAGVEAGRKIFYSLSPFAPPARPPRNRDGYDRFLANSAETQAMLRAEGVVAAILPNLAPRSMFAAFRERPPALERAVCVSNHLPPVLRALRGVLGDAGIGLDFVGRRPGSRVRRVDAELLAAYDLVVTIGKTVAYALAAGLPVYCHDKWGGHGYVLPADLDHAEAFNFSGRCCRAYPTVGEIAAEIRAGFGAAFAARQELHAEARRRYDLKERLAEALAL